MAEYTYINDKRYELLYDYPIPFVREFDANGQDMARIDIPHPVKKRKPDVSVPPKNINYTGRKHIGVFYPQMVGLLS